LNIRPYKEGIKTSSSMAKSWMSRYLNIRPYKEGIKTYLFRLYTLKPAHLNIRPYKEGIKTFFVIALYRLYPIWISDLIKKGLRRFGIDSIARLKFEYQTL